MIFIGYKLQQSTPVIFNVLESTQIRILKKFERVIKNVWQSETFIKLSY
jgi:hypothetical protein